MNQRYLFLVGLPRTGSHLIENILRNCAYIDYQTAGETFFIGQFITSGIKDKVKKIGDMSKDANIHKLVDYFYTETPNSGFWNHLRGGTWKKWNIDKKLFLQQLLASDRTIKGIYEVILQIHTTVTKKTILGDKSGGHLYHVKTLLEYFPEAKVIHHFRDPRAILASQLNKRILSNLGPLPIKPDSSSLLFNFLTFLHITITWIYAARLHRKYKKLYPRNYHFVKFEGLITNSEKTVMELCEFLEIEFDPNMLQPKQVASSFTNEKAIGYDKQTLVRWQSQLQPWMQIWMSILGKKYLKKFGYLDDKATVS